MRKLFLAISLCFLIGGLNAQKYVSKEPSNRVALIEEFTGIGCGNCPDGHRIVAEIMKDNPEKVYAINIHQGEYAAGQEIDLTTGFGDELYKQSRGNFYPSGTVNRHIFTGFTSMSLPRSAFRNAAKEIINSLSYVNMAGEATIDFSNRLLTVEVELYYTKAAEVESNNINVALLQNNILAHQEGMYLNPSQIINGQYNHQHALRHLLTGQWGEEVQVSEFKEGSLVTKTYTYTIPENFNSVPAKLADLDVLAFVCQGQREVITACNIPIKYINAPPNMLLIERTSVKYRDARSCDGGLIITAVAKNVGESPIAEMVFNYYEGDVKEDQEKPQGSDIYVSLKTPIAVGKSATIEIPVNITTSGTDIKINLFITKLNGSDYKFAEQNSITNFAVHKYFSFTDVAQDLQMVLEQDKYGSEITWKFLDKNNSVVAKGGPYSDLEINGTQTHTAALPISAKGCYKLSVSDFSNNGINSKFGKGSIKVVSGKGDTLTQSNGVYKNEETHYILFGSVANEGQITNSSNLVSIYPNPAKDFINIAITDNKATNLQVVISDMNGVVYKRENVNSFISPLLKIDVSELSPGIYFAEIRAKEFRSIKKFIIFR